MRGERSEVESRRGLFLMFVVVMYFCLRMLVRWGMRMYVENNDVVVLLTIMWCIIFCCILAAS